MRSSEKPSSSSRSFTRRSPKAVKPAIFAPRVAEIGLVTSGSATRMSSKATSLASISRVVSPGRKCEKLGSSWKSIPSRRSKR